MKRLHDNFLFFHDTPRSDDLAAQKDCGAFVIGKLKGIPAREQFGHYGVKLPEKPFEHLIEPLFFELSDAGVEPTSEPLTLMWSSIYTDIRGQRTSISHHSEHALNNLLDYSELALCQSSAFIKNQVAT